MKTFVGLFAATALFGISIDAVYWFASHDYAGALLLGFMSVALSWAAVYSFFAERKSHLAGDQPDLKHRDAAGEDVDVVTKETPWPLVLALGILTFFVGTIWSDFLIFAGLGTILLSLWRLGAESARVGHKRVETKEGPTDAT
jgi:hypothetical protein